VADDLQELLDAVQSSPEVLAALDAAPSMAREARRTAWTTGRRAFRTLLRDGGAKELVARVLEEEAGVGAVAPVSRLAMVERLLARAAEADAPPLYRDGEAPAFEGVLARSLGVRWEPAVDGRAELPGDGSEHPAYQEAWSPYRPALTQGGRTWSTLRKLEDFQVPDGPARGFNPRVRIQTFGGSAFEDPAAAFQSGPFAGLYKPRDQERFRLAPRSLDLRLEPWNTGDLYLLLVLWDMTDSTHLELEIPGEEATLRLPLTREAVEDVGTSPAPPDDVPGGYAVRIRGGVLPAGARRLRVRAVGVQGVGRSEATVLLGEVLQLTGGAPPAVFDGHRWGVVRSDPTEADARRQQELTETLARMEARGGDRRDPDAIFQAARAMAEAGSDELALVMLQRADRLRPDHPPTLNLLGEVAWRGGKRDLAVRSWERSRAIDPRGRALELLRRHAPEISAGR
jgi:hypothetical protein